MTVASRRVVVLGLGNPLYGDDGLGPEVVAELERRYTFGPEVELVDGGTAGLALLGYVEDTSHLLLIDAVLAPGKRAGDLVLDEGRELAAPGKMKLSEHQVEVAEVLGLAAWRGRLPERCELVGAVPGRLAAGQGLSPEVRAVFPEVLRAVATCLQRWGVEVRERPEAQPRPRRHAPW